MRHLICLILIALCIAAGENVEGRSETEVVHQRVVARRS